jgi:hypothetical protein
VLKVTEQGRRVKKRQTISKLVRRGVTVALCCIVVLQAFIAGCSLALSVSQASQSVTAVICHGGGDNRPAGPDDRTPASDACAACAICTLASAAGLPAPTKPTVTASRTPSHRLYVFAFEELPNPPPARAGFARAPPGFA